MIVKVQVKLEVDIKLGDDIMDISVARDIGLASATDYIKSLLLVKEAFTKPCKFLSTESIVSIHV